MTKYYDIGNVQFKLEETSKGNCYLTEQIGECEFVHEFSTKLEALNEILSFAEIDEDDYYSEEG